MTDETLDDIVYFLKKGNLKALQQAQLLLNAAVEKAWLEEHTSILEHPTFPEGAS